MSEVGVSQAPSEQQLAWLERHAARVLIAGVLVSANILIVMAINHFYVIGGAGMILIAVLVTAAFLLLHRAVARMMRTAVAAARREARITRIMMQTVDQIGAEHAGVRGTVEALVASTKDLGIELVVWEAAERTFWSPNWERAIVATPEEARVIPEIFSTSGVYEVSREDGFHTLPTAFKLLGDTSDLILAPMHSAGDLLGFVVRRYKSGEKQRSKAIDDQSIVGAVATIASVALSKAAVVDSEQQRARDNELLLRSVHIANESRQRDQLTEHVQQAIEAAGVSRGAIFALNSGRLSLVGSAGIARIDASGAGSIRLRSTLVSRANHAGVESVHCGIEELDEASAIVLTRLGFEDEVLVQGMRDSNGLLGLIVLEQSVEATGTDTDGVLAAIGHQASMVIERTRMMRSMRKRSRHLARTPKLARSLTGQRDADAVARIAVRELHAGFGFGRVSIALHDDCLDPSSSSHELRIVASAGMDSAAKTLGTTDDSGLICCSEALLECGRTGRPYVGIVGDIDDEETASLQLTIEDGDAPLGCRGRIVVPIAGRDRRVMGAIAVYEKDPDLLGEDDLHMLETVADQLGGTLEQAELCASLERSYFETVEALSSALEAKDAYTLDHARSITEMSAEVGRRLNMREDEIRDLKLGALLHDIGKIGIPNEILSKNGPLTDDEFEVMKEHTIIGEQIIASVEFLQGVRPLVLHEHERWDGRGYPHQLKGEEIPLGARIIFVCDSWHAMTSDRPYRRAMDNADAIAELRRGAGSQFDPAVVQAFCDLMREELDSESSLASFA